MCASNLLPKFKESIESSGIPILSRYKSMFDLATVPESHPYIQVAGERWLNPTSRPLKLEFCTQPTTGDIECRFSLARNSTILSVTANNFETDIITLRNTYLGIVEQYNHILLQALEVPKLFPCPQALQNAIGLRWGWDGQGFFEGKMRCHMRKSSFGPEEKVRLAPR